MLILKRKGGDEDEQKENQTKEAFFQRILVGFVLGLKLLIGTKLSALSLTGKNGEIRSREFLKYGENNVIKLKVQLFFNSLFLQAAQKLFSSPINPYSAFRLKKTLVVLEEERKRMAREFHEEIVKVHAERNENGELKTEKNGNFVFKDEKAYAAACATFMEQFSSINAKKISLKDLNELKLSASEIGILSPLLDEEDQ